MTHPVLENFRLQEDARGVLKVALDVPGQSYNVFNERVISELQVLTDFLEHDSSVRLVVFSGGKASGFSSGGDIREIAAIQSTDTADQVSLIGQRLFDRINGLPIPTVAVIHGPCLGGGLEFAMACSHRVARDDATTRLGLPEVELGLLPGWGGTQRLPQLVGLTAATTMILTGKRVSAGEAAKIGLVDLASSAERFEADVEAFLADRLTGRPLPSRRTPIVDRLRDKTRLGRWSVLKTAQRRIAKRVRHYPALPAALGAIQRGVHGSRDEGLAYERTAFADLLFTPTCRNLMELFFQRERARRKATWVSDGTDPPRSIQKVAVAGAGAMGAGIAQLAAYRGFEVVLRDVNEKCLRAGMRDIQSMMERSVRKGLLSSDEAAVRLAAVEPCVEWGPLDDVDLAIEAVTERQDVKRKVFRELDQKLPAHATIASNTSALAVAPLAAADSDRQIAGLHFFNPVHRMPLVEVIRTDATSDETIDTLVRFVRRVGKTPIVAADKPGFLVNRILFAYLDEAVHMVREGIPADSIDGQMRRFGMPMGPLELLDYVGLDVAADVAQTLSPPGTGFSPTADLLTEMVARGWTGKKSGCGFYRYRKGRRGRSTMLEGKTRHKVDAAISPPGALAVDSGGLSPIQLRLVCVLINQAARCLQKLIVTEPWMVDLGMVLGTGFAPFRGGPLRMADRWGTQHVVLTLERLWRIHGDRFAPCRLLEEVSYINGEFYPKSEQQKEPFHARHAMAGQVE